MESSTPSLPAPSAKGNLDSCFSCWLTNLLPGDGPSAGRTPSSPKRQPWTSCAAGRRGCGRLKRPNPRLFPIIEIIIISLNATKETVQAQDGPARSGVSDRFEALRSSDGAGDLRAGPLRPPRDQPGNCIHKFAATRRAGKALAILHEEIEHEAWFSEFLGEGPSGHLRRQGTGVQRNSPSVSKFLPQ